MRLKRLDHTALIVRDLQRSRWFYGEVLGLEEIPRPRTFGFRGSWYQGPGFQVHLILAADTTAPVGFGDPGRAGPALAHHIGIEVDDLEEAIGQLREHGVEIVTGPIQRGDGVVQLYVGDPDGHVLEFFAWAPTSALPLVERPAIGRAEQ